jgi:hypothetical protein
MQAVERAVIDGFCYSLSTLFVPGWYKPMALGQLEALRKAGGYRSRWYTVPEDGNASIPAYSAVEQQLRITPGSYLYGYMALTFSGANLGILVRIVEGATGIALMEDALYGASMSPPFFGIPSVSVPNGVPTLLSQPRLIVDPGWVNVELSNPDAADGGGGQIILLCAEPCTVLEPGQKTECIL